MKYEINTEIVFSTAHITEEDSQLLFWQLNSDNHNIDVVGENYAYGYRILAYQEFFSVNNLKDSKLSEEFWELYKIAKDQKCRWLVLDQDGKTYDNLKTFEW